MLTSNPPVIERFFSLWKNLTTPHQSITGIERRKQSQLLASFVAVLILVTLFSGVLTVFYYRTASGLFNFLAGLVLSTLIFSLNHRGHYLAAARLMVMGFFLVLHFSLFSDTPTVILYMAHLLLICGIFLSLPTAVAVACVSIAIQIVVNIVDPISYSIRRIDSLIFTIISVPIVAVFIAHRRAVAQAQQAELRASNSALQESEARWRSLVENAPDFIMEIDLDLNIRFINSIIPSLKPADVLGKPINTFVAPDYQNMTTQRIQSVIETKQPVEYEVEGLNAEGTLSWYSNMVNPIIRDGKVTGVTMISRDVTLRKQVEAQSLAYELERERVRTLEEMIGNLSHDLKTPLGTIRFSLSMLQQLSDAHQQQIELETISNQAARLERLIQNILTMSRLDHLVDFKPTSIAVNDIAQNIVESVRHAAAQKNVSIAVDFASTISPILGDETELDRALTNLVGNAITYTPPDGSVSIKTYAKNGYCVVEISDTGIGIADEDLPKIFDRFYRSSSARQSSKGGTGLGLAIVKRIIDMHHGKIEVESQFGAGTTFRVMLPSAAVNEG